MDNEQTVEMEDVSELITSGILASANPNALFKADDVRQGPICLTISGFIMRKFTDKTTGDTKIEPVLIPVERGPGLKITPTRMTQLKAALGTSDIKEMVEKKMKILIAFDDSVKFQGRKVGGIKILPAELLS